MLYTELARKLRAKFPKIFISGEVVSSPASFPAVIIMETRNTTYARGQTIAPTTNYAQITYTVDIYSNKTSGKKSQCKEIASFVDDFFIAKNFLGELTPTPNMDDATIYRMTGRYRAVVGADGTLYRDI